MKIFETSFLKLFCLLKLIWGMRKPSNTGLQVIILCQKIYLATVTQEKHTTSENRKHSCIGFFSNVLVFIIPQSTRHIDTSGHIPGMADT